MMGLDIQGNCIECKRFPLGCIDCDIVLDNEFLQPPNDIRGLVKFHNPQNRSILHYGVFVQLEAKLVLRYADTQNVYSASKSLLEGSVEEIPEGEPRYCRLMEPTVIRDDNVKSLMVNAAPIVKKIDTTDNKSSSSKKLRSCRTSPFYAIKPQSYSVFSFRLKFPKTMHDIPAPFSGPFGSLTYSVAAYIKSVSCNPLAAEKTLKFCGLKNLSNDDSTRLPVLSHSSGYKKSFLSKENSVTAVLTVGNGHSGGYLPDEELAFSVAVDNPKGFMLMRITVSLIRKSRYKFDNGGVMVKECGERLVSIKIHQNATRDLNVMRCGRIRIPTNSGVSYSRSENYKVSFHLQYEVIIAEFGNKPLGGFLDILIGSTREREILSGSVREYEDAEAVIQSTTVSSHSNRDLNLSDVMNSTTNNATTSRNAGFQDVRIAHQQKSSLLPSYSQLFPRSNSVETLPPHYDDLTEK